AAGRDRHALWRRLPGEVPRRGRNQTGEVRHPSLRRDGIGPRRTFRPGSFQPRGVKRLELLGVEGLPEVRPGDDLAELIAARARFEAGDVLVVAQKVVSKAEGRIVDLNDVTAGAEAVQIAGRLVAKPDPRMVQVVLDESVRVRRSERVLITETRHGYVSANAGIDHSNTGGRGILTLLPLDPDSSAGKLRDRLREVTGVEVGVIVSDTFGRPWRLGIVNIALGVAGVPALVDLRGTPDDNGEALHAT